MQATMAPPEKRVLVNCSWDTYGRLLAEAATPGTRFTYADGVLEIMVVSAGHEDPNRTLAALAEIVAEETDRDIRRTGSTTFQRADLQKGFEPDSCFYIEHADAVRGKDELDLAVDPPPDLVIEVDITRSSLNRFSIFAAVGVPEVWRFDGESVSMFRLGVSGYEKVSISGVLPPLTARQAGAFLEESKIQKSTVWLRRVRDWVRSAG